MTATFTMNEAYFRESLVEWIDSVSKGRKYEPWLCALFGGLGLVLSLAFPGHSGAGFVALLIGLIEGVKYVWFRRRWLAARVASSQFGRVFQFSIEPGVIRQMNLETKETSLRVAKVTMSKRGYFVSAEVGASFYIPHASIIPAATQPEVMKILAAPARDPLE